VQPVRTVNLGQVYGGSCDTLVRSKLDGLPLKPPEPWCRPPLPLTPPGLPAGKAAPPACPASDRRGPWAPAGRCLAQHEQAIWRPKR
jgi:hypothetical protein